MRVEYLNRKTESTTHGLEDVADAQYEEINKLREQFDTMNQSNPPTGDYELTQCAAYGSVHLN